MDSLSAFDDLYTAIEACLIYPDEVIDRLARAFYPAILACWNSEEGQREFAAWQAEQVHLAGKEKQEVPAGELPAVHIILVCGFWQGTSGWAHPVFLFLINKMEQIGQYDHSNNYSKKKHGQSRSALRFVCFMERYPLLAPQIWLIFAASSLASAIILSQSGVI